MEKDDYYADYIQTASDYRIIFGVGNGLFNPDYQISRQDMVCIIMRAYERFSNNKVAVDSNVLFPDDMNEVSEWAQDYVRKAYEEEIVLGVTKREFKPKSYATRAEAAAVIVRAINKCQQR